MLCIALIVHGHGLSLTGVVCKQSGTLQKPLFHNSRSIVAFKSFVLLPRTLPVPVQLMMAMAESCVQHMLLAMDDEKIEALEADEGVRGAFEKYKSTITGRPVPCVPVS